MIESKLKEMKKILKDVARINSCFSKENHLKIKITDVTITALLNSYHKMNFSSCVFNNCTLRGCFLEDNVEWGNAVFEKGNKIATEKLHLNRDLAEADLKGLDFETGHKVDDLIEISDYVVSAGLAGEFFRGRSRNIILEEENKNLKKEKALQIAEKNLKQENSKLEIEAQKSLEAVNEIYKIASSVDEATASPERLRQMLQSIKEFCNPDALVNISKPALSQNEKNEEKMEFEISSLGNK